MTPYLVRPVSGQLALPTDGYRAPTDVAAVTSKARPSTGVSGSPPPAIPARRGIAPAAPRVAAPGFKL